MRPDELAQYQGLVAVGGDGLFQELVMGLLKLRGPITTAAAGAAAALAGGCGGSAVGGGGGGGRAAATLALQRMRIGHIPGGSTDAVAFT